MLRLIPVLLAISACGAGHSGRPEPRRPEPLPTAETQDAFVGGSLAPFASFGAGVRRIDAQAR